MNVTATNTTDAGFLTVYPSGCGPAHHLEPELRGGTDRPQPRDVQARRAVAPHPSSTTPAAPTSSPTSWAGTARPDPAIRGVRALEAGPPLDHCVRWRSRVSGLAFRPVVSRKAHCWPTPAAAKVEGDGRSTTSQESGVPRAMRLLIQESGRARASSACRASRLTARTATVAWCCDRVDADGRCGWGP